MGLDSDHVLPVGLSRRVGGASHAKPGRELGRRRERDARTVGWPRLEVERRCLDVGGHHGQGLGPRWHRLLPHCQRPPGETLRLLRHTDLARKLPLRRTRLGLHVRAAKAHAGPRRLGVDHNRHVVVLLVSGLLVGSSRPRAVHFRILPFFLWLLLHLGSAVVRFRTIVYGYGLLHRGLLLAFVSASYKHRAALLRFLGVVVLLQCGGA
mmetsp:Transcript_42152/g.121777  ORF Transcript_42152/g.121777 Transcript_42152/m.121777 type:complete len:209 (+) Transcript_42152:882-1508(+)